MPDLFEKSWSFFLEKKISFLLSGILIFLCIISIWLYYSPAFPLLYKNHFVPHFAAVFFEIALAIVIIEEVIKSKRDIEKKTEKRKFFMSKMQDKNIDTVLYRFLRDIEKSIDLPNAYRDMLHTSKSKEKIRLLLFMKHAGNFGHTIDTDTVFEEELFRNEYIEKIISKRSRFFSDFFQLLETWKTNIEDIIESISLTSDPHDTKYASWDYIVGLHIQMQKFLRNKERIPQKNEDKRIMCLSNVYLTIYILTLKAYCMLLMDYKYDFQVRGLSNIHDFELVNSLYKIMKKRQ